LQKDWACHAHNDAEAGHGPEVAGRVERPPGIGNGGREEDMEKVDGVGVGADVGEMGFARAQQQQTKTGGEAQCNGKQTAGRVGEDQILCGEAETKDKAHCDQERTKRAGPRGAT